MKKIDKKMWAVVTGATSGIGKSTSTQLAAKGYSLLLLARRSEILESLKTDLIQRGAAEVRTFVLDVQDRFEVSQLMKAHSDIWSDVNVLINSAGLALGVDSFQTGSLDDYETMIDTNVKGLIYLTRSLLPFMIQNKAGHIVNLGSVAGRYVYPSGAVYCASKFAVRALSEGLRMDLLGTGIKVTNIEPGMVNTEFSQVRLDSKEKADAVYAGMTPLSADDIADTIVWCLDRPSHVNIQELVIYPTDQAHVGQVHRQK